MAKMVTRTAITKINSTNVKPRRWCGSFKNQEPSFKEGKKFKGAEERSSLIAKQTRVCHCLNLEVKAPSELRS